MIHARGTHVLGLGLEEMLLGEDPLNPESLWDKMYTGSFMTGHRGLGIGRPAMRLRARSLGPRPAGPPTSGYGVQRSTSRLT
jgi:hypothetical protein